MSKDLRELNNIYPVIPLRDIVVFPHMLVTLFVGRDKSLKAIEAATEADNKILLLSQKDSQLEDPDPDDLYKIGVIANINQLITLPDGTVKVLVEGVERVRVEGFSSDFDFFAANITPQPIEPESIPESLIATLLINFTKFEELNKKVAPEVLKSLQNEKDHSKIVDLVASNLPLIVEKQHEILQSDRLSKKIEMLLESLMIEMEALRIEEKVKSRVKQQIEKNQREYYLSEQMKAIQNELQRDKSGNDELTQLKKRLEKTKLTAEAREKAESELRKLSQMNPMSSESSIVRNYLEWLLDVPWKKPKKLIKDLKHAKKTLDRDHHGLEKIKDRILEHLSVQSRLGKSCGQIICLVGPPGVGKTSLGRSIAEATGRAYTRVSLGGVRDESEIRGHRRTYIGAMPGRIIQGMKKANSSNPVFLLDEIDKLGADWRGDPSAALLEVLDPAQNKTFNDHYLEVDYDLSDVFFIATANSLNMPRPLLDRMEIIHLSGYTEDEKIKIAEHHLLKKQLEKNGIKPKEIDFSKGVLTDVIRYYTREAGVRSLERALGAISRKALKEILTKGKKKIAITRNTLKKYLGVQKFKYGLAQKDPMVGVTTGLAWTEAGGDILMVEVSVSNGKGKVCLTGKLGEVMQESIQTALSFVRSRAHQFGIPESMFLEKDLHVHFPEGAVPKDGPSAGIAICTSLVSILTNNAVKSTVAMTGEITLRGQVLPIGGVKEKLLAAQRAGITTVLLPEENRKDLEEVPKTVVKKLDIHFVDKASDVFARALVNPLTPIDSQTPQKKGTKADKKDPIDVPQDAFIYTSGITGETPHH